MKLGCLRFGGGCTFFGSLRLGLGLFPLLLFVLEVVVDGLKKIPDGLEIDVEAGQIYWTNMGNPAANDGSIERVDLDGGNRTTIVPSGATRSTLPFAWLGLVWMVRMPLPAAAPE